MEFKKPVLSDRPWIQRIYEASGFRGAEYTFANLYLWSSYYGEVVEYQGYLCQRLLFRGVHQYIYPAGSGDVRPVLEALWDDSRREGRPFVLRSLTKETMAELERLYPGICRPISLRTERFNQDLSAGALLIEVGAAGNTHAEALTAAEALAQAIAALAHGANTQ